MIKIIEEIVVTEERINKEYRRLQYTEELIPIIKRIVKSYNTIVANYNYKTFDKLFFSKFKDKVPLLEKFSVV